jgi:hypothetical protein
MEYRKGIASKELPMSQRVAYPMVLGAMLLGLWPAVIAKADDQQLVEAYLQSRGISGAVVRAVTDDSVGRTFPDSVLSA